MNMGLSRGRYLVPRGWGSWLAVGVISLWPTSAAAEPARGADRSELVRLGAEAAAAGRWLECVDSLAQALALEEAAVISGNLGLCEEQAGRFALAHRHLRRALEATPGGIRGEPWDRYQAAFARVREHVALVFLTTDPPDARVVVDGRPLGKGDGRTVAVEPGKHVIVGRLPGYRDKVVETADLHAGDSPNVQITLEPVPVEAPPSVPSPWRLFEPAWSPRGVLVTMSYTVALTAVVSGVTALGYEVHFRSLAGVLYTRGYRDATCRKREPPSDPVDCAELFSRVQARDTSMNVWIGSLIALGALSGMAGLAMSFDRGPWSPKVKVTAGVDGGGIVLLGNW